MNRRTKHLVVFIAILCSTTAILYWVGDNNDDPQYWITKRVSTPYLSITLPNQGWSKQEIHAADFKYAKLSGDGIKISVYTGSKAKEFDYTEEDYIIEYRDMNGHKAKIITPRGFIGVTGMTYKRGSTRITFEAHNLTRKQKEKVLMIFETAH